jgi:5'-3' exonuclease
MVALLDMDSLAWIVAYNHRENSNAIAEVKEHCDEFIKAILTLVQATHYIGAFSDKSNFRYLEYKYALYKGQRPERPEWFKHWEPIIKQHCLDHWGFILPHDLEADDVLCAKGYEYMLDDKPYVICSPDKDLRQIPGLHFDYKKQEAGIQEVTSDQAMYNLYRQILSGDTTDNIKGIPGMGEVKAMKFLDTLKNEDGSLGIQSRTEVIGQYRKYFGEYYGPIIFEETVNAVQLLSPIHKRWPIYRDQLEKYEPAPVPSMLSSGSQELLSSLFGDS